MSNAEKLLQVITELSHEFGGDKYVKGGGGNTSCKTDKLLWVKPSGTTLATIKPESFVMMHRAKLDRLFKIEAPKDPTQREALVKDIMEESKVEGSTGRASVEAPLHNCLRATYVVHTHPLLVNALTCSIHGKSLCERWFPKALWVEYIDPGYTLSVHIDGLIKKYEIQYGQQPDMIILQNHGIFIAGNSPEDIRKLYAQVMDKLEKEVGTVKIENREIGEGARSYAAQIMKVMKDMGPLTQVTHGVFALPNACLTPDHIVYMKSRPFYGNVSEKSLKDFNARYGYLPKIFIGDEAVVAVADSERSAQLAMTLAKDAAMVSEGAQRLGGIHTMGEEAVSFIENWEVESYRQKQMA